MHAKNQPCWLGKQAFRSPFGEAGESVTSNFAGEAIPALREIVDFSWLVEPPDYTRQTRSVGLAEGSARGLPRKATLPIFKSGDSSPCEHLS
jgi:hypothetical protein